MTAAATKSPSKISTEPPRSGMRLVTGEGTPWYDAGAMTQPVDPRLADLEAARAGDRAALRRLLESVGPAVMAVAGAVMGRGDRDVEDVVQDSLVGIVQALHTFRGESSFVHFARSIALRRALDYRRSRARRGVSVEIDDTHEANDESPPESLLASRRREAFRGLLETLPEAQAEAFALRVLFGYSIEEIAEQTSAPIETIRSRLRLAKAALRARITNDPTLLELSETDDDDAS